MDKIFKRLCVEIILLLIAFHFTSGMLHTDILNKIKPIADKRGIIDGFFKPDRSIGAGFSGTVWKGLIDPSKTVTLGKFSERNGNVSTIKNEATSNIPTENSSVGNFLRKSLTTIRPLNSSAAIINWKPIAMKIISQSFIWSFTSECRIFKKLLAYKNQTVEQYGIPSVWFTGNLDKFSAIGMTLCSTSIMDKQNECGGKFDSIDVMIIIYQAIVALKYIHGKEVVHNDVKLKNLMLRGSQLFMIDFNAAALISDLMGNDRSKSKLHAMHELYLKDLTDLHNEIKRLVFDTYHNKVESEPVKKLLDDFYIELTRLKCIVDGENLFDYNAMGNKILDVIGELSAVGSRDPIFTWLSKNEKSEAKKNLISIESVPGFSSVAAA